MLEVLGSLIEPDDVTGVVWGRTLHAMVQLPPPQAHRTVGTTELQPPADGGPGG